METDYLSAAHRKSSKDQINIIEELLSYFPNEK